MAFHADHFGMNNLFCPKIELAIYFIKLTLHKTLSFLKLDDIYLLELAKIMSQLHHKKFKTALNDCFVDITKIHSHNTRTKDNIVYFKPCVQTSAEKKSLTYRGIELWGKIELDAN